MINFYSFYNKTGLDREEFKEPLTINWGMIERCKLDMILHIIKRDPELAWIYVSRIIRGRWIEGEAVIMKDPINAYCYAFTIIQGRWLEAEPYIMKDPWYALVYAKNVIKGRWKEAEPVILEHDFTRHHYCKEFGLC